MKFLCVCQFGHSRSVALTRVLHGKGLTAIAVGWASSGDGLAVLSEWADKILVLETWFSEKIPLEHRSKIVDFNVGRDRWSNLYNQELLDILGQMVNEKLGL